MLAAFSASTNCIQTGSSPLQQSVLQCVKPIVVVAFVCFPAATQKSQWMKLPHCTEPGTLLNASEGLFILHIHAWYQKGASAVFPLLPAAADGDANHFPEIDPNKHPVLLLSAVHIAVGIVG